jgi:hypothetical protein
VDAPPAPRDDSRADKASHTTGDRPDTPHERHRGKREQASRHVEAYPNAPCEPSPEELEALVARWDALGLPEAGGTVSRCRPSERAAILNKVRALGVELVELAIDGAGGNEFLRAARARSAVAWAFHKESSVRRLAEEGLALRAARERGAAAAADRVAHEAREAERVELVRRAPWIERERPEFYEALDRGDFEAAEAMLPANDGESALTWTGTTEPAPDALAFPTPDGLEGVRHIAPAIARTYAAALNAHADAADAEGPIPRRIARGEAKRFQEMTPAERANRVREQLNQAKNHPELFFATKSEPTGE